MSTILFNRVPRRVRDGSPFPYRELKALGFQFRRSENVAQESAVHVVAPPPGWRLEDRGRPHTLSIIDPEGRERGELYWNVVSPQHFESWSSWSL